MPKANIVDKSEPSHLSSILNLLRGSLFDSIQRPHKDMKGKVVRFCRVAIGIEGRVATDQERAVTC